MDDAFANLDNPGHRHLFQAGHVKRLINFLVDYLLINLLYNYTKVLLMITATEQNIIYVMPENEWQGLYDYLFLAILYSIYMGLTEAIFKGKSLGKLITGTRAVNRDGTRISTNTAFLRGLCRAIPLSTLSALGLICYPWHDRWTDTIVIDEALSGYIS
jgi:uncharacterized RDD family membrane protein YckC